MHMQQICAHQLYSVSVFEKKKIVVQEVIFSFELSDIGSKFRILRCLAQPECSAQIQYPRAQVAVAIEISRGRV